MGLLLLLLLLFDLRSRKPQHVSTAVVVLHVAIVSDFAVVLWRLMLFLGIEVLLISSIRGRMLLVTFAVLVLLLQSLTISFVGCGGSCRLLFFLWSACSLSSSATARAIV